MIDWYLYIYGIFQIANLFLAAIAGFVALSLFKVSHERIHLRPWKVLIIGLVLFAILEIVGALRSFGVYTSPFLTHILTSGIVALLLVTLILQNRVGEE